MTTATTILAEAEATTPRPGWRARRASENDDTRRTNWWATALIAVCSLTVLCLLYTSPSPRD